MAGLMIDFQQDGDLDGRTPTPSAGAGYTVDCGRIGRPPEERIPAACRLCFLKSGQTLLRGVNAMPDENSQLEHQELVQAAFDSLAHVQKRMDTWRRNPNQFDRINKHRIRDKELLEQAFLQSNPTRRRDRAYNAYQARQNQFTQKWLERGSFFNSVAETLNSLRPAWGDAEVERFLAELPTTAEVEQLARFIDGLLQKLFDQLVRASQDSPRRPSSVEMLEPTETEAQKAERRRLIQEFRDECKRAGRKVTDDMIGLEVKPDSADPRTIVQKWLRCDPRYEAYDARIRRVFREKPHLTK